MELDYMQKRTWAEVDLDALKHNYKILRDHTPNSARICCIIKADAYGHGSVRVARLYEELGADYLAVSNVEEAMTVRRAGVSLPILILGYTHPSCAKVLAENHIAQCVYSYEYGKALAEQADNAGVTIAIHLKIDVGMGRLGFIVRSEDDDCIEQMAEICRLNCFRTEGVFTHFPMADEGEAGKEITRSQLERFCHTVRVLEDRGIRFDIKHCCNSAAAIKYPEYSLDMVRLGVALYGVAPQDMTDVGLVNTLSLKTVISNIKEIKKGESIGYGSEYVADQDILVATLPVGYADGFKRENYTNRTRVSVNGVLCPITGRVCMDQIMVDVSACKNAAVGDEVVLYGSGSEIDLEAFSRNNGKIPYETMCEISARVPIVYRENGNIESIRNSLV